MKDACHKMRCILNAILITAVVAALPACHSSSTTSPSTTTTSTSTGGVPVITSITPASGPIEGGTSVNITGTGFTGASNVLFGTTPATAFVLNSDTLIVAVAPAGTAGTTLDITVVNAAGTSATGTADLFQWGQNIITSFTASATTVKSGTPVTVTANFLYTLPAALTLPITWTSVPPGSNAFLVPPQMLVASGSTSQTLQVTTFYSSTPQQVTLSATYANITQMLTISITP